MENEYVLDLKTDETRPIIRIDDIEYFLKTNIEYTDLLKHNIRCKKIGELSNKKVLNEKEELELKTIMKLNMASILDADVKIIDSLTSFQKLSITRVFGEITLKMTDPTQPTQNSGRT